MKRTLSLLCMLTLTGCQWWGTPTPTPGAARMVPRGAQDTLASLQAPPQDQQSALASLTMDGSANYPPFDLKSTSYKLDVADFVEGPEQQVKDQVFADYLTALSHAQAAGLNNVLPSVNLVDGITKQVNDGLYAALELIWERTHKQALRQKLFDAFKAARAAKPDDPQWQALVTQTAASLQLAGQTPDLPSGLQAALTKRLADFSADQMLSKPIAFYTWTPDLERIFQADRMAQSRLPLTKDGLEDDQAVRQAALAAGLMGSQPDLAQAYDETVRFYARMTNPFMTYSPTSLAAFKPAGASWDDLANSASQRTSFYQAIQADQQKTPGMALEFSLLPPSRSTETTLFMQNPPPDGTSFMDWLIQNIQSGAVSMAPTADSGAYQYQEYALQALLTPDKNPESAKLTFGDKYKQRLRQAFETGLTKARDTNSKQLGWGPVATAVEIPIQPRLFVEPLPTVYRRYGDMYAFIEQSVLPLFADADLSQAHLLTESGQGTKSLKDEVSDAKNLMYGLYLLSAASIGMTVGDDFTLDAATRQANFAAAKTWLSTYNQDARLAVDTRVVTPVAVSENGGKKYLNFWGTAGVTLVKVQVDFADPQPSGDVQPTSYFVIADKFISFQRPYDKGVLNRDEYRKILDSSKTLDEALQRLASE